MTTAERMQVVREALALTHTVTSVAATPLPELTLSDLGEPAALARPLRQRLAQLLDDLYTEPYRRGEEPVVASVVRHYHPRFGLVSASDTDGPAVVDTRFETADEANEYARSHGMVLAAPDQHDDACICDECADTPGAGHSPDRAEAAR